MQYPSWCEIRESMTSCEHFHLHSLWHTRNIGRQLDIAVHKQSHNACHCASTVDSSHFNNFPKIQAPSCTKQLAFFPRSYESPYPKLCPTLFAASWPNPTDNLLNTTLVQPMSCTLRPTPVIHTEHTHSPQIACTAHLHTDQNSDQRERSITSQ